jgi:hypothetical protein
MTTELKFLRRYLQVASGYGTTSEALWEEVDVTSSVTGNL